MTSLLGRLSLPQSVFNKLADSYWKVLKPVEYEIALGSSAITDAIMLWRCLVVWNNDWRAAVVPVLGLIGTHASAFFIPPESPILAASVALNNLFLTGMIAFRMIKMSKEAIARVRTEPRAIVRMGIATVLESGSINSVYTTLMFGVSMAETYIGGFGKLLEVSMRLWPFVSNTVSAIILARSALGMSFNNVESAISSLGGVKSKSPVDIVRTVGKTLSDTGSSITKDFASLTKKSDGEPSLSPVNIVRTVGRTLSGTNSEGKPSPAIDIVRTLSGHGKDGSVTTTTDPLSPVNIVRTVGRTLSGTNSGEHSPIVRTLSGTGKEGSATTAHSEAKPSLPVDTIVRRVSGQFTKKSDEEPSLSPVDIVQTVGRTLSGTNSEGKPSPTVDIVRTLSGTGKDLDGSVTTHLEVKPSLPVDTIVRRVSGRVGQTLTATNRLGNYAGFGAEPSSRVEVPVPVSDTGNSTPKDGDTSNNEAGSERNPGDIVRTLSGTTKDEGKPLVPKHHLQDPISKTTDVLKAPLGKIFPL
ncbi:hypothetical protein VNI00_004509 [Paramarasmius palmivorus]|uniref:Transmembrane protein n=1 Tax=Paramarasmius palmivorus TaxID=297713 RepID=A0AAW0DKH0_9AGAR